MKVIREKKDAAIERTCIACRKKTAARSLLRFVKGENDTVAFDVKAKAPARGSWTCFNAVCVKMAVKKNAFSKAFLKEVVIDEAKLLKNIYNSLMKSVLSRFGLIFKMGLLIPGRALAIKEAKANRTLAIVTADDLSERSLKELDIIKKSMHGLCLLRFSGCLKEQIKKSLGRTQETGVVALLKGDITKLLICDLEHLSSFYKEAILSIK
ncbi:YlxR family protein [Sulfobacillus acidophilus]|uniref:YlxR family protein n=1 Tax=Sulfobacillus acidophilus TaxID=53633 RepID=A0ABS3B0M4_9FIRM|nr:YlxR family protein [Sulfobacillus acidophilus]